MSLSELGWNDEFSHQFEPLAGRGLVPARVVAEHRGSYVVASADGDHAAKPSGRLRHSAATRADLPAVGDWVGLHTNGAGDAVVEAVLPRRTKVSRKVPWAPTEEQVLAANVDVVLVVGALGRDLNARRLERYLTLAWESGAEPVIVLTKTDLHPDFHEALADVEATAFGVPVHAVSALTGDGVGELALRLGTGRTAVLLGSSGVGKSTLLNRLLGVERQRTSAVREGDDRGRHTTSHRELVQVPGGGCVIDTPGIRELQLWASDDGFRTSFADIEELSLQCRFNDCAHEGEPGCAIAAALADGSLDAGRWESYCKLQRELRALAIRQDKRAKSEQRKEWRRRQRMMRARVRN